MKTSQDKARLIDVSFPVNRGKNKKKTAKRKASIKTHLQKYLRHVAPSDSIPAPYRNLLKDVRSKNKDYH